MDEKRVAAACAGLFEAISRLKNRFQDLRLEMLALRHDLEATRRERDCFRGLLLRATDTPDTPDSPDGTGSDDDLIG